TVDLPYVAGPKELNLEYKGIKLKRFLPFAEDKMDWKPVKIERGQSSSRYRIYNDNFGEFITLTLHPLSDFNNTVQMGPLNVHYMPDGLESCFATDKSPGLILWNGENSDCMAPDKSDLRPIKAPGGQD